MDRDSPVSKLSTTSLSSWWMPRPGNALAVAASMAPTLRGLGNELNGSVPWVFPYSDQSTPAGGEPDRVDLGRLVADHFLENFQGNLQSIGIRPRRPYMFIVGRDLDAVPGFTIQPPTFAAHSTILTEMCRSRKPFAWYRSTDS